MNSESVFMVATGYPPTSVVLEYDTLRLELALRVALTRKLSQSLTAVTTQPHTQAGD